MHLLCFVDALDLPLLSRLNGHTTNGHTSAAAPAAATALLRARYRRQLGVVVQKCKRAVQNKQYAELIVTKRFQRIFVSGLLLLRLLGYH
jgi:hypothetical protein